MPIQRYSICSSSANHEILCLNNYSCLCSSATPVIGALAAQWTEASRAHSSRDQEFWLALLYGAVRFAGVSAEGSENAQPVLLKWADRLLAIIQEGTTATLSAPSEAKSSSATAASGCAFSASELTALVAPGVVNFGVRKAAGKLARNLLFALTHYYATEFAPFSAMLPTKATSLAGSTSAGASSASLPWRLWSSFGASARGSADFADATHGGGIRDLYALRVSWHEPSAAELDLARRIVAQVALPILVHLDRISHWVAAAAAVASAPTGLVALATSSAGPVVSNKTATHASAASSVSAAASGPSWLDLVNAESTIASLAVLRRVLKGASGLLGPHSGQLCGFTGDVLLPRAGDATTSIAGSAADEDDEEDDSLPGQGSAAVVEQDWAAQRSRLERSVSKFGAIESAIHADLDREPAALDESIGGSAATADSPSSSGQTQRSLDDPTPNVFAVGGTGENYLELTDGAAVRYGANGQFLVARAPYAPALPHFVVSAAAASAVDSVDLQWRTSDELAAQCSDQSTNVVSLRTHITRRLHAFWLAILPVDASGI